MLAGGATAACCIALQMYLIIPTFASTRNKIVMQTAKMHCWPGLNATPKSTNAPDSIEVQTFQNSLF